MTRPVQPLGTFGQIAVKRTSPSRFSAGARYRDANGRYVRISATDSTSQRAVNALKAKVADYAAEDEKGELHRNTSVEELAEFWLAEVRVTGRQAPQTLDAYEQNLRAVVLPALGKLRLREVTVGRVDRFLKALAPEHPTQAQRARVVLGLLMKVAVRHDAIDRNPVRDTAPVPHRRKEVRALDQTQLEALREAVRAWRRDEHVLGPRPDGQLGDVIDTILGTSARIGEALALRVSDVDLVASPPTVTISGTLVPRAGHGLTRQSHPKHSKHWRIIAVPSFTAAALRTRIASLGDVPADHPVFATRNGTFITPNNLRRQLRAVLAAADLPESLNLDDLTPHVLRKTVATTIDAASSSTLAAELLGHSSILITETFYIQPTKRVDPTTATILERLAPAEPATPADGAVMLW
jgi:integrase